MYVALPFSPLPHHVTQSTHPHRHTQDESRQQGTLCDKDGKTIDADLFDVDTWRRLKLGVFSTPRGASDGAGDDDDEKERGPTPERVVRGGSGGDLRGLWGNLTHPRHCTQTHLREVLHRGETFRGLLHLPVPHYPSLAVLSGVGHPTEAVVMQDGPQVRLHTCSRSHDSLLLTDLLW